MGYITYQNARDFIYRNARPLDFSRFQYHFEGGSSESVLDALLAYQNNDGGFGHALEPDIWNPYSNPIQTFTATEILREINFTDKYHPIIKGILEYLVSGKDFEDRFWYQAVESNNDFPHAPWWHVEPQSISPHTYNPSAALVGFIIRYGSKESDIYRLACSIIKEAYEYCLEYGIPRDMATLGCIIRMTQYLVESNTFDIIDTSNLLVILKEKVKETITKDTSLWLTNYICKPSLFISSNSSAFYDDNMDIAEYECKFIVNS